MVKRTPPKEPQPARLSPQQIRAGIPKLERRLKDLKEFDFDSLTEVNHADKVNDIQRRTEDTLADVFGHGTIEFERYSIGWIDGDPRDHVRGPHASSRANSIHPKGRSKRY
jgi:hypothetical protein